MPRERIPQSDCQSFLAKYYKSKLTVADFCKKEKICVATFYNRKQRADFARDDQKKFEPPITFLPLRPDAATYEESLTDYRLELPGGFVLRIPMQFNSESARSLIHILRSSC